MSCFEKQDIEEFILRDYSYLRASANEWCRLNRPEGTGTKYLIEVVNPGHIPAASLAFYSWVHSARVYSRILQPGFPGFGTLSETFPV